MYHINLPLTNLNPCFVSVTVDMTPPTTGEVLDGLEPDVDLEFSSHRATVSANWDGFGDPESDIIAQSITVYINGEVEEVRYGASP